MKAKHSKPIGHVTWHCSERGGGPDVGLLMELGSGFSLWCGDISRRRWEEAGEEARDLGGDFGWWCIIYGPNEADTHVIGKCLDREAGEHLFDALTVTFHRLTDQQKDETL